jgi:hypothetical protein
VDNTPPGRQIPHSLSDRTAGDHRRDDQPDSPAPQDTCHALLAAASLTQRDCAVLLPVTSVETVHEHDPHRELDPSAALRVPDPQFPTRTPAGRQPGCAEPLPGDQPDPTPRAEASSTAQLRACGLADECQHVSLPIRTPGAHLHPLLRRPPAIGRGDEAEAPAQDPFCDVDGTPVDLFCLVEQVAEDTEPTMLASWLHQHGQVIGRGLDSIYVCFSDHHVVSLRPDLVRVLDPAPGGD